MIVRLSGFLFGICALAVTASACAASYPLRQSEPDLASNVRRNIGTTSIPMDRSYASFTPQEQADFRATVPALATGDEPAYPAGDLRALIEDLSKLQHVMKLNAELSVLVRVGANGRAESIAVLKPAQDDFQQLVSLTLLEATYVAGTCGGVPCARDFPFTVRLGP